MGLEYRTVRCADSIGERGDKDCTGVFYTRLLNVIAE